MKESRKTTKKKGLGRGLESILPEALNPSSTYTRGEVSNIDISLLMRNPSQARQSFDENSIRNLADSIKQYGILHPIIVRPHKGGKYEIVAGERRWRAAQLAELKEVPCIIKQTSENQTIEINLIENIQRQNLNPIEKAQAIEKLIKNYNYTQEKIAQKLSISRPAVANLIRLLELPPKIKQMLIEGKITEGHARALLSIPSDVKKIQVASLIIKNNISVREVERLVSSISKKSTAQKSRKPSPSIKALCDKLQSRLGTKVSLVHSKKGTGKIIIFYRNLNELDRILFTIFGKKQ